MFRVWPLRQEVFGNVIDGNAEIGGDGERLWSVAATLAGLTEGEPGTAEAAVGTGSWLPQTEPGRQAEGSGKLGMVESPGRFLAKRASPRPLSAWASPARLPVLRNTLRACRCKLQARRGWPCFFATAPSWP